MVYLLSNSNVKIDCYNLHNIDEEISCLNVVTFAYIGNYYEIWNNYPCFLLFLNESHSKS
jgi:hypothetical protein